jgi:hypothetical protein
LRDRIRSSARALAATLFAGLALSAPARAQSEPDLTAQRPRPGLPAQALDAVIVRPVGLVAAAVGAVLFVPAAIISAPGGLDAIQHALDIFVLAPGKFVFQRPLGDF